MRQLNATVQSLLASGQWVPIWLFQVTDGTATPSVYHWSHVTFTGQDLIEWDTGIEWAGDVQWASIESQAHSFRIIDFKVVKLTDAHPAAGQPPRVSLEFVVGNPQTVDGSGNLVAADLTPFDFEGGTVLVSLILKNTAGTITETAMRLRCSIPDGQVFPDYGQFKIKAIGFIEANLQGRDYPHTRFVRDLFPMTQVNADRREDNVCVPRIFGAGAYVPVRLVSKSNAVSITATTISAVASTNGSRCYIRDSANGLAGLHRCRPATISGFAQGANNSSFYLQVTAAGEIELPEDAGLVTEAAGQSVTITQQQENYLLGAATSTYTISEARTPKEHNQRPSIYPYSASPDGLLTYAFDQSTLTDADANDWTGVQAILNDIDLDGYADVNMVWDKGGAYFDMPLAFTDSTTLAMTSPDQVISQFFQDLGLLASDLDLAGTFASAATTYATWGLTWTGGWYYKEPADKTLANLLAQCHSTLRESERIQLVPRSKTSVRTLTSADIITRAHDKPGEFKYTPVTTRDRADSGNIAWQQAGAPQDRFVKLLVPSKTTKSKAAASVLRLHLVQDSQDAQRLGSLYYQLDQNKIGEVSAPLKAYCLDIEPGDVVTISGDTYGGTYDVRVDEVEITKELEIRIKAWRYSVALDDFTDLNPTAITVVDPDLLPHWDPNPSGPLNSLDQGRARYDVYGSPYLIVAPNTNQGQFTSIQNAINALAESRHNGILVLNGTYAHTAPIYLLDRDIEILGESRGGVILQNAAGQALFNLHNLTSILRLASFSIASQNSGSYGPMVYCYGDTAAQNTAQITIEDITMTLAAATGEYGVRGQYGDGRLVVKDCRLVNGGTPVHITEYEHITVRHNEIHNAYDVGVNVDADTLGEIIDNLVTDYFEEGIRGYNCKITGNQLANRDADTGASSCIGIGCFAGSRALFNRIESRNTSQTLSAVTGIALSANGQASENEIILQVNIPTNALGVVVAPSWDNVQIVGNRMQISNAHSSPGTSYGVDSSGNGGTIDANNIVMGGAATDTAIRLDGNNNQGSNTSKDAGTALDDQGTGNTVTVKTS